MRRPVVHFVLGFVLATVLWWAVTPFLTDEQESIVFWLLMGTYAVAIAAVGVVRRRRHP
jgi:hypothetical protein